VCCPSSSALRTAVEGGIRAGFRPQVPGVQTPSTWGCINEIQGVAGQSTFLGGGSSARPQVPIATAMPVVGKMGVKGKDKVPYKVSET
jgi:hypothetical protein